MRWPDISHLSRSLILGPALLLLAQAAVIASASAQTTAQNGVQADNTTLSAAISSGLPDSPGTVLRRRMQPDQETGDISSQPTSVQNDPDASPTPLQTTAPSPTPEPAATMTGAQAKASDARRTVNCPATPKTAPGTAPATAGNGIVGLKSAGPNGINPPGGLGFRSPASSTQPPSGCSPGPNPYQRFLNSGTPIPLTPHQKAFLALHNFIDPGNIVTILGTSGIAIASDSHTAYGPGWRGFGRNAGISAVQDATGDFFGTFLIPAVTREDPHYHRMPTASIPRRTLHAISRTIIAQGDDGHAMPNYATLLTYPITAEIANLYVPGVAGNGPSTAERILTGYATDPIDNLITEFLPDVAKRVHVRVIFVQQIINQVAAGQPINMFP